MVNLGSKVRDTVTGFEGVAYGRTDFMYGCARIIIESTKLKDGSPIDHHWFDEQRVEQLEPAAPYIFPATAIQLGSKVRDSITGFEGIASGRTVYLYGPPSITIEPQTLHEGKPVQAVSFTEGRVKVVVTQAPTVSKQSSATSGGPQTSRPAARSGGR